ncbi:MAG: single-stranded-DNA-specific exonuclease RecJ [Firmicutes bacterium]|nr:single-stranded-DNA-specific exonuclease RecJ [Bacillota bacterium]
MLKAKYRWNILQKGIVPNDSIYEVILKNRGIDDPDHFFSMGQEMLIDPFLLKGMDRAVARILKAISASEKILIYGDYDCDGVTAISVLYRSLKRMKANVYYDLPNRFVDGYGLNPRAVEKIIKDNYQLVITVDNGITCNDEVKRLNDASIDTIITDHHEIKDELPDAFQILHTKLSENYPFKEIAGVMVAYKLASALLNDPLVEYMDLVMIGTIADLMPLENENQAMVNLGIAQLRKTKNLGLKKLIEFSHLDIINETAVAFKIAPKINSSGRLGKALEAVKLLVTDSELEVNNLILQIEENHAFRKDLTEEAFALCEKLVNEEDDVLVISSLLLHEGIIGICAQKIAEKYQKSTCVITLDEDGIGKGSMRSFGGDNILKMLESNQHLLLKYGGHSQAAGLQVAKENIGLLKEGFLNMTSSKDNLSLEVDMEVDLSHTHVETVKKLQDKSFFTAKFLFQNLVVKGKQKLGNKHTKLTLETSGLLYEALMFNSLEYYFQLEVEDIISVIGGLNINTWRKKQSIQIMIKDLKCNHTQVLDFRNPSFYKEGAIWLKPVGLTIDDDTCLNYSLKTLLQDQKPDTIYLLPSRQTFSLHEVLKKETLAMIYKAIPENDNISFFILQEKTKLPLWALKRIVDVFLELEFIKKTEEGYFRLPSNEKQELNRSKKYLELVALKERIDWLYTEPIYVIKKYLLNLLEA